MVIERSEKNAQVRRRRRVATFITKGGFYAKETFFHHPPGIRGPGFVGGPIVRDRNEELSDPAAWDSPASADRLERRYYATDWQGRVVSLVTAAGVKAEDYRYSATGVPFGIPLGDVNADGKVDGGTTGADYALAFDQVDGGVYDARVDLNLNGNVDWMDEATVAGQDGVATGRGELSARNVGALVISATIEWHSPVGISVAWSRRSIIPFGEMCNYRWYFEIFHWLDSWRDIVDRFDICSLNCMSRLTAAELGTIQEYLDRIERICGCRPQIKCRDWVRDGSGIVFPTPGCPVIYLSCKPTSVSDILHELIHVEQVCRSPLKPIFPLNPVHMCEDLICMELQAHFWSRGCEFLHHCCERACNSVRDFSLGICSLARDCERKCQCFSNKRWCGEDGRFRGPITWPFDLIGGCANDGYALPPNVPKPEIVSSVGGTFENRRCKAMGGSCR